MVFYSSFYLPESLLKPSVPHEILEPDGTLTIDIVPGAQTAGNDNYVPNSVTATLTVDNHLIWINNDDTGHTVTPDHRLEDSYSGSFGSDGVLLPGEQYEFIFTEETETEYFCIPHPWMRGSLEIVPNRFA